MIRQNDFRRFQARFHPNGVAGAGFYVCSFLFLRGKNTAEMQAVVFDEPGCVAVITQDINARYRGDEFEPALRAAIEAVRAAQPDALHRVA